MRNGGCRNRKRRGLARAVGPRRLRAREQLTELTHLTLQLRDAKEERSALPAASQGDDRQHQRYQDEHTHEHSSASTSKHSRQLVQATTGYRLTVKSGVVAFEDGEPTGALPGASSAGRSRRRGRSAPPHSNNPRPYCLCEPFISTSTT